MAEIAKIPSKKIKSLTRHINNRQTFPSEGKIRTTPDPFLEGRESSSNKVPYKRRRRIWNREEKKNSSATEGGSSTSGEGAESCEARSM